MDAGEWLQLLVLCLAGSIGGLVWGFRSWRRSRLIEDTPLSRVRSATQGYVELAGRARLMPGPPILAPLTSQTCAWWQYRIEEYRRSGKRSHWETIEQGTSDSVFLLEDDTGSVMVDPEGADVYPGTKDEWRGDTPWPVARPSRVRGFRGFGDRYRYTEHRLMVGDPLYAIGWFGTERAATGDGFEREVSALLASWKQDPKMKKVLDVNHDGTLDQREWEAARLLAQREVRREAAKHHDAVTGTSLMRKPADGRPFLLGAMAPEALAGRLRLYAGLGWSLFVLGAAGATALLQFHP